MPGINAGLFSSGISSLSTAASDLFAGLYTAPAEQAGAEAQVAMADASAQADLLQGQGDILEGQTYGLASTLAQTNAAYTAQSTAIQESQAQRQLYMTLGTAAAAAGGSGNFGGGAGKTQPASSAGETQAAADYQQEANLFGESATGDFFGAALSGVAGVAQLFMGTTGIGTAATAVAAAV